jgi:hypothetical protein
MRSTRAGINEPTFSLAGVLVQIVGDETICYSA